VSRIVHNLSDIRSVGEWVTRLEGPSSELLGRSDFEELFRGAGTAAAPEEEVTR
jgi:hypothetical protein